MEQHAIARFSWALLYFTFFHFQWAYPQQTQSAEPLPTFHSQSELVTIPVVVTDSHGQHLSGLTKGEFQVFEDGKPQNIAVFEEVKTRDRPLPPPQLPRGTYTNITADGSATSRVTVLMFDMLNTQFEDQAAARQTLVKYLDTAESGEPTALLYLSRGGLKMIHDFTLEPQILAAALRKFRAAHPALVDETTPTQDPVAGIGDSPLSTKDSAQVNDLVQQLNDIAEEAEQEFTAFQQRSTVTMTLDAMLQIAFHLGGIPGRKALVWASGGFPFSISDAYALRGTPADSLSDVLPLYHRTWKALNQAEVALYPVDVRGLTTGSAILSASLSGSTRNWQKNAQFQESERIDTFRLFADMTGGKAYYHSNDLVKGFREAIADNSAYYVLAYYLDRTNKKPGWHKLAVKTHIDGARLRSRSGFYFNLDTLDPVAQIEADFRVAANTPIQYTAIPLTLSWTGTQISPEPGKTRAVFSLSMPPGALEIARDDKNHVLFEVLAVAKTGTAEPAASVRRSLDGHLSPQSLAKVESAGVTYAGAIDVPAGEYSVRIVVRDHLSGRLGSLTAPLRVESDTPPKN